jgi:hypothetical protein
VKAVEQFVERFGVQGWVRLLFYPVTSLITTPVRLAQTLWSCRKLGFRWWECLQFNAHAGLSYLFYWTVAMNLSRYGRGGRCPHMGTGDLPMSRFFYHCAPSLIAYWKCGAAAVLIGMFGWWGSQWVWLESIDAAWVVIVLGLALVSTTFYANTFAVQNYNALGWMFFPFGLHGLMTGDWLAAGVAWFAASFFSFTVVTVAGLLSLATAAAAIQAWPLLALGPAALKLSLHFRPLLSSWNFGVVLLDTAKSIGLADGAAKYRRTASKSFGIRRIYYLVIYVQFLLVVSYVAGDWEWLVATGIAVFVVNARLLRFADEQSMTLMMLSLATAVTLQTESWLLLASYWLLASPIPLFAGFPSFSRVLDIVPKLAPFSIRELQAGMEKFLEPVHEGQRVLMAFESPNGVYENIFDGYRILLELPLYVASGRKIHFVPDWWAVFELNRKDALELWGRDPAGVEENIRRWKADFAVVYQPSGSALDDAWDQRGFKVAGKFSWKEYGHLFEEMPYSGATPDWWLLKKP